MLMTLTNNEIYSYTNSLAECFPNGEIKMPVKVNFYLQKNQIKLYTLAQEIEKQRIDIIKDYGVFNEETQEYDIPEENIAEASQKVNELFSLTQDVKIYKVKLEDFGDMSLTAAQMQALLFMIEDKED